MRANKLLRAMPSCVAVEDAATFPQREFRASDRRYRRWHERYKAYKRRRPDGKPLYYENKRDWKPGYPRRGPKLHR